MADEVLAVSFDPMERYIACGCRDKCLRVIDQSNGEAASRPGPGRRDPGPARVQDHPFGGGGEPEAEDSAHRCGERLLPINIEGE